MGRLALRRRWTRIWIIGPLLLLHGMLEECGRHEDDGRGAVGESDEAGDADGTVQQNTAGTGTGT